jgi:hypothetical protein
VQSLAIDHDHLKRHLEYLVKHLKSVKSDAVLCKRVRTCFLLRCEPCSEKSGSSGGDRDDCSGSFSVTDYALGSELLQPLPEAHDPGLRSLQLAGQRYLHCRTFRTMKPDVQADMCKLLGVASQEPAAVIRAVISLHKTWPLQQLLDTFTDQEMVAQVALVADQYGMLREESATEVGRELVAHLRLRAALAAEYQTASSGGAASSVTERTTAAQEPPREYVTVDDLYDPTRCWSVGDGDSWHLPQLLYYSEGARFLHSQYGRGEVLKFATAVLGVARQPRLVQRGGDGNDSWELSPEFAGAAADIRRARPLLHLLRDSWGPSYARYAGNVTGAAEAPFCRDLSEMMVGIKTYGDVSVGSLPPQPQPQPLHSCFLGTQAMKETMGLDLPYLDVHDPSDLR